MSSERPAEFGISTRALRKRIGPAKLSHSVLTNLRDVHLLKGVDFWFDEALSPREFYYSTSFIPILEHAIRLHDQDRYAWAEAFQAARKKASRTKKV